MDQAHLLAQVTALLARLGLPYLVIGSTATIAYGEPRLTLDIERQAETLGVGELWREARDRTTGCEP